MNKHVLILATLVSTAGSLLAGKQTAPAISGDYVEVRSCNVYTGSCIANSEMGLTGKEGILVWSIRQGSWQGIDLEGMKVIAVVRTPGTMGDQRHQPQTGKAVLIVDDKATSLQREALRDFAQSMGGTLINQVVEVKTAPMEVAVGECAQAGCARVKAGDLVEVNTRCIGGKDHLCGNEETYYPPLTQVQGAYPVFTEMAAYRGGGLDITWQAVGERSAFLASFAK